MMLISSSSLSLSFFYVIIIKNSMLQRKRKLKTKKKVYRRLIREERMGEKYLDSSLLLSHDPTAAFQTLEGVENLEFYFRGQHLEFLEFSPSIILIILKKNTP